MCINMFCLDEIKSALEKIVHTVRAGENLEQIQINPDEDTDIISKQVCDKNLKEKDCEIQIDLTGGCEIMTAFGLMIAQQYGLTPTYVDFQSGYMFHVLTMERLAKIEQVCLADYLTAIGGKVLSASKQAPEETDFARILSMAEIIFSNEKKWDEFFFYLTQNGYSARGVMEFSMKEKKNDKDCCVILDAFLDRGFAKMIGKDRYRFSSEKDKAYMTISGIWLEMYLYIQGKKCFDN